MGRKPSTSEPLLIDETTFWAYIRLVDWRSKSKMGNGIEAGKTVFSLLLPTMNDRNLFRARFDKVYRELSTKISRWEEDAGNEIPCSDDGFSDLLAHIVGLGKEEYCAVLENPRLVMNRANNRDYVESFAYCIPYANDYKEHENE